MSNRGHIIALAAIAALALVAPVAATDNGLFSNMGTCSDGSPREYNIVDANSATDCSAGGGTSEAHCCCLDGAWAACDSGGGGGGAPTTLDYFVGSSTGSLSAERVGTDTASVDVDLGTAGQVKFNVITPVASASDLSGCTNCIGGTEIDESALGAVPTATALAANPTDCSTADGTEFAWRINASGDLSCATIVREPSLNTIPASASSYDDEFTSTTLDAQWTATTIAGNATAAGSLGLILSPAAPVRDLTTVPGWFMWQSDSAGSSFGLVQPWTEDTTSMFFARCQQDQRNYSASQEGSIHFGPTVIADTNESVFIWANTTGTALSFRLQVQNNGAFTEVASTALHEIQPLSPFILLMVRNGNSYYGFVSYNEGAAFTYLGTVTKSGVTTFDEVRLVFIGANETPSPIMGCDYFRYETDNVFPTFTR